MYTVLLDMDGVVADLTNTLLDQYNYLTNEKIAIDQIKSTKTFKWVGDPMLMKKLLECPGFMRGLPPIDGAIEGVEKLVKLGYDVVFVSNATNGPTSGHEKREWLKFYFSKTWTKYVPLILTHQKYRVRGDVLLDDDPKNFENLRETKGLLFNQPYNASLIVSGNVERIYGWDHFLDWLSINGEVK